jgi:phytoene dehydrogenase-like protein
LRYDVCVIGAGTDGLAAAILLARAGLKVIAVEHGDAPGGRCTTREFHPGFRASPFLDEIAPIPPELFWSLGLGRAGVTFQPSPASMALWPDRAELLAASQLETLDRPFIETRGAVLLRAREDFQPARPGGIRFPTRETEPQPWPGVELGDAALAEHLAGSINDESTRAHVMARSLEGRAADPFLYGSALQLVAPGSGGSGVVTGGMAVLAEALASAARSAGVEIRCGMDVADIRRAREKVCGVSFADGTDIVAGAVISTLDVKRTFLSFFQWNALPPELSRAVSAFRFCGSTARLLIALDTPPDLGLAGLPEAARAPIHIAPDIQDFAFAQAAWRSGTIPERPPMVARVLSAADPRLAPIGAATMTVTLGGVPYRLFDGAWTHEKRDQLRDRALGLIESVLPGTKARVRTIETIVPPDMEEQLGVTDGDLWGGEIASDQMFDLRPGFATTSPRTPIDGLYLAGPSSSAGVLATYTSGALAARAVLADRKAGYLR